MQAILTGKEKFIRFVDQTAELGYNLLWNNTKSGVWFSRPTVVTRGDICALLPCKYLLEMIA